MGNTTSENRSVLEALMSVSKGIENLPVEILTAIQSTLTVDRFDVTPGRQVEENILRANLVVFHPGSDLTIGKPTDSFVALVADRVVFQDGSQECRLIVPKPEVGNGSNGAPGHSGNPHGGNGGDGVTGEDGPALPICVFWAEEIRFEDLPNEPDKILVIEASGVRGGNGGSGANGGAGAHGANGRESDWECERPDRDWDHFRV